jgi:hypothetical protein
MTLRRLARIASDVMLTLVLGIIAISSWVDVIEGRTDGWVWIFAALSALIAALWVLNAALWLLNRRLKRRLRSRP